MIVLILGGVGAYFTYKTIYKPNINLGDKKSQFIYIPTGSKFETVVTILSENNMLENRSSFEWLSEKKKYKNNVKAGKYRILANMSNNQLINLLKAGIQEPVTFNFNGLRTINDLIRRVSNQIEADSLNLYYSLNDNLFLKKYGFNRNNAISMFIPNTYTFYWNTSQDEFLDAVLTNYHNFWTETRIQKAQKIGFSVAEVTTLASIVQSEQCCDNNEKKVIAGLYINRLKKGKELESDPTVIYAIGNFAIQRVSFEQLHFQSPYNTYLNKGLPPGPICFVQQSSMDAVLNYSKNDYIFMCAKEDFSGKHNFAKNYQQHLANAKKYRNALNKRGIH